MTERLEFGKTYTITAKAERIGINPNRFGQGATRFEWQRIEIPEPVEALYIGYRFVYNGIVRTEGENSFSHVYKWYEKTKTVEVYLFVLNERANPIYVLPEDVVMPTPPGKKSFEDFDSAFDLLRRFAKGGDND
jgi:hypothetical protein